MFFREQMRNLSYKLICIDMDGTLLDSHHNLSEENKTALKNADKLGVTIAICTGRIFTSAKYYSDLIGINAPIIASNGAYIKRKDSNEVIYKNTLSIESCKKIIATTRKYNLRLCFNTGDTVISEIPLPDDHPYKVMNQSLPVDQQVKFHVTEDLYSILNEYKNEILKGIVIEETRLEDLFKSKDELKELAGDTLHIVSSWNNNFEVMEGDCSKGTAVKNLAIKLGIPQDEVICIGDSENDLSMIKFAELGIAMGNAMDIVKNAANYVTDTNDNSGVAKAINKFIISFHN